MGSFWRWMRGLALTGLVVGAAGAGWAAWAYHRTIVVDPGPEFTRQAIMDIIAQESPILYRDGKTRIGVLFAREHREYVPYDQIPKAWIDAIVSAEDAGFFDHGAVDPQGILRALFQNIRAGRIVAGGSTLTQQTAKNLFYRPDRSFRSKWDELIDALKLEAHFTKQDILEFYANQFHVNGNGRGLGIAARYFFDKDVSELTTLECAFLAGMVKAPARYNPFIGTTEARRAAARERAKVRTRYVLDRMLATGRLSKAEHDRLVQEEIPFKRGTFRYDTSVLLDEVSNRLDQPPFPELFASLGIDNVSTAGIQVVTTIDPDAEREATYALWHHLSEVGPLIEGLTVEDLRQPEADAPLPDPDLRLTPHEFRYGRVSGVVGGEAPGLVIDLGGPTCTVDEQALDRMATVFARAKKGERWKKATSSEVEALAKALPPKTVLWVSLRDATHCDIEVRPKLQGAALVVEHGRIRAMVGGNDNKNFNRATAARRQLGSTWKPLIYDAALQLGWTPTDVLDNRENVFPFEGTWYYPRPDHHSVARVSLAWAGTRSENLASIWLLAHLVDRLSPQQFKQVAARVGLTEQPGESRAAFIERIRDRWGVISVDSRLPEAAYTAAVSGVLAGLDADSAEWLELFSLPYGRGFDAEVRRVKKTTGGRERARKLMALSRNFLRYEAQAATCVAEADKLRAAMRPARPEGAFGLLRSLGARPEPELTPAEVAHLWVRPKEGRLLLGCGDMKPDSPPSDGAPPQWARIDEHLLSAIRDGLAMPLDDDAQMRVEGPIRVATLRAIRHALDRRLLVMRAADPYDFEVLQYLPDFRKLVAMRYVARLARAYGVQADVPPVLSMPLGAVDITLEEAARLYEGLIDGQRWTFPGLRFTEGLIPGLRSSAPVPSPETPTELIAEIRDRDGNVLYRAEPRADRVGDAVASREVGDVLRNVVRWGTGRRANGTVTLGGRPVPVAGKTGTTNGYKNAAFSGFVPRLVDGAWRWGDGYTVVVYVGYDDNRTMRRGGAHLEGASGALPAWIGIAQGLADSGLLGAADEVPADGALAVDDGYVRVPVAATSGLPLADPTEAEEGGRSVLVAQGDDGTPERRFAPFRPSAAPADARPPAVAERVAETKVDGRVPHPGAGTANSSAGRVPATEANASEVASLGSDGGDAADGAHDTGLHPAIAPPGE